MLGRRITDIKEINLDEVHEILEQSTTDLGFEQVKTLEYSKKFTKLPKEKATEMVEELMAAVAKINRAKATKIADLMPKKADEVSAIFVKEIFTLTEEEVQKIIETVNKYAKA
jgi:DNA-directed RNA polymerase subunit F